MSKVFSPCSCKDSNRNTTIDIMKCIGMICIIIGHTPYASIHTFVYTFHIPLFFFISGYFLNQTYSIKTFVQKKFKALIIPYLTTCGLIILLSGLLSLSHYLGQGSFSQNGPIRWIIPSLFGAGWDVSSPFHIEKIGAIWFLLALFWGIVSLRLLLKTTLFIRISFIILAALWGMDSYQIFQLPWSIQPACVALPWIYAGYLWRLEESKLTSEFKVNMSIIAIFLWLWGMFSLKSMDICMARCSLLNFVCSFGGILFIWSISRYLSRFYHVANFLAYFGQLSIVLLAVHLIMLDLTFVPLLYIIRNSAIHSEFLRGVILITIQLVVPFCAAFIIARKKSNLRFFGQG